MTNVAYLTTNGIAKIASAISSGGQIVVNGAQIGTEVYTDQSEATLVAVTACGGLVYTASASAGEITYNTLNNPINAVQFNVILGANVGNFNIGNFGMVLNDGSLLCIVSFDSATAASLFKFASSGGSSGNVLTVSVVCLITNADSVVNLTVIEPVFAAFPEVSNDAGLPLPASPPYPCYFVHEYTEFNGQPAFAGRFADEWFFNPLNFYTGSYNQQNFPPNWNIVWSASAPDETPAVFMGTDANNQFSLSFSAIGSGSSRSILTYNFTSISSAYLPIPADSLSLYMKNAQYMNQPAVVYNTAFTAFTTPIIIRTIPSTGPATGFWGIQQELGAAVLTIGYSTDPTLDPTSTTTAITIDEGYNLRVFNDIYSAGETDLNDPTSVTKVKDFPLSQVSAGGGVFEYTQALPSNTRFQFVSGQFNHGASLTTETTITLADGFEIGYFIGVAGDSGGQPAFKYTMAPGPNLGTVIMFCDKYYIDSNSGSILSRSSLGGGCRGVGIVVGV